jgi:hypothetical protein
LRPQAMREISAVPVGISRRKKYVLRVSDAPPHIRPGVAFDNIRSTKP